MERILSVGDCTPVLVGVAKSVMAGGANHHEALNLIRITLDKLAAEPEKYLTPRGPLPEGYQRSLDEAFGAGPGDL
jgi:hypothetical protein